MVANNLSQRSPPASWSSSIRKGVTWHNLIIIPVIKIIIIHQCKDDDDADSDDDDDDDRGIVGLLLASKQLAFNSVSSSLRTLDTTNLIIIIVMTIAMIITIMIISMTIIATHRIPTDRAALLFALLPPLNGLQALQADWSANLSSKV